MTSLKTQYENENQERRLRKVIKSAEPTKGTSFAHWFGPYFILVRKTKVILCRSDQHSSKMGKFEVIVEGKRNVTTYCDMARIIFDN